MNWTVVGVLILFAAVAPGLLFVSRLRRYRVEGKRSDLEEVGTAVAVGGLATFVSASLISTLGIATGVIDSTEFGSFIDNPVAWVAMKPEEMWFVVLLVVASLALSGLSASGLPAALNWWQSWHAETEGALVSGDVWQRRLHPGPGKTAWCEIVLDNGRELAGYAKDWSLPKDPSHPRDLALEDPIYQRNEAGEWVKRQASFVILRSDSIKMIEVEIVKNEALG